jgi:RNA recognition motif-containing protein
VSVRLFVGSLPYTVQEADLRKHFASVGEPSRVAIPVDRETGAMRGFAFVDFEDRAVAEAAIRTLDGQPFGGRLLKISEARPRGEGPPPRFGPPSAGTTALAAPTGSPARASGDAPRRTFGPNAVPKRGGKARRFGAERAPKGPIRVRSGGRVFDIEDDGHEDIEAIAETGDAAATLGGDPAPNENSE